MLCLVSGAHGVIAWLTIRAPSEAIAYKLTKKVSFVRIASEASVVGVRNVIEGDHRNA
jgi:hypothetical protein